MIKNFLLVFLFLLVFSSLASADLTTDLMFYTDFDTDNNDIYTNNNNNSFTTVSGTTSSTGLLGNGLFFDGDSDYICLGDGMLGGFNKNFEEFSVSYWINSNSTSREGLFWFSDNDDVESAGGFFEELRASNGQIRYQIDTDDATDLALGSTNWTGVEEDAWVNHLFVFDNGLIKIYKNGTNTENISTGDIYIENPKFSLCFGGMFDANNSLIVGDLEYDGYLDEMVVWNRTVTSAEAVTLYNTGSGCNFIDNEPSGCAGGGLVSTDWLMNVTALDNYNNSIILFDVNIKNGSLDFVLETTNGTVNTALNVTNSSVYNFSFIPDNFFPKLFQLVSPTQGVYTGVELFQSEIRFNVSELVSGNSINNYTINDSTFSVSTINGSLTLNLLEGNITLDFVNDLGYYNFSFVVEVIKLDNKTVNLSAYNTRVTVFGYNFSGSVLPNLSGNVSYVNGWNMSFNSSNSSIVLNLTSGLNYSFFLTSYPDFTFLHHTNFQSRNVTVNDSFNFTLFADQSIFFSANDVISGVGLTNFNLTLSGATDFVYSGLNASTFQFGITVGNYNLLADKSGYASFSQLISIVEGNLTNVSALMTNVINEVVFVVNDVFGNPIQGVSVVVTRSADDSLVSSGLTDGFGEVQYTLNDLLTYNLNVSKSGFITFFEPLSIIEDTYIITLEAVVSEIDYYNGLLYSFLPIGVVPLINNTVYNFSFNISSSLWNVTGCWLDLLNDSNILVSNYSFCGGVGGFGGFEFNVGNYSFLTIRTVVELNNTNISLFHYYNVKNFFKGEFSLMVLLDDIKAFSSVGFNDFSRFFLVIMIIIGLTVGLVGDLGFVGEPSRALIIVWLLVAGFSVGGLLSISFVPFAKDYIVLILLSLLLLGTLIVDWKVNQSG